jgi:hypothetical protein
MAAAPITFGTFRTVFLHNEASFISIPRLVRDFSKRRGLQSRAAMVFIIATLIFVLVFPTFGSALTGYSANVQSYVQDASQNYIPFSSFSYAFYVIHDGSRVGLYDDYPITLRPQYSSEYMSWIHMCSSLTKCVDEALLESPGTTADWSDVCFTNSRFLSNDVLSKCTELNTTTNCTWASPFPCCESD